MTVEERLASLLHKKKLLEEWQEEWAWNSHCRPFNPPLPEEEVWAFEVRFEVSLPEDYRQALLCLGDGGLDVLGGTWASLDEAEEWVRGDLAEPFPFTQAVTEDELESLPENGGNAAGVSGWLPLFDRGCAMFDGVVVAGPERGNLWESIPNVGFAPVRRDGDAESVRYAFCEWLDFLLDEEMEKRGIKPNAEND
jgi:hypothetical protein